MAKISGFKAGLVGSNALALCVAFMTLCFVLWMFFNMKKEKQYNDWAVGQMIGDPGMMVTVVPQDSVMVTAQPDMGSGIAGDWPAGGVEVVSTNEVMWSSPPATYAPGRSTVPPLLRVAQPQSIAQESPTYLWA